MANEFTQNDMGDAPRGLESARAELAETIETAGLEHAPGDPEKRDDLVKVGSGGLSFELRFNSTTIALDGKDVNVLDAGAFQDFLQAQKLKVEAGELDDQIRRALEADGPGKALARVRSVDSVQGQP